MHELIRTLFRKKSCHSSGTSMSEVLVLTMNDGVREWRETVFPCRLRSNALVRVRDLSGRDRIINTTFVVNAERMSVIVNRQDISDWDCYKGHTGRVFKYIWYAVPLGWSWDDFDEKIDTSDISRHVIKKEIKFED